jgi:hypothetical protein
MKEGDQPVLVDAFRPSSEVASEGASWPRLVAIVVADRPAPRSASA